MKGLLKNLGVILIVIAAIILVACAVTGNVNNNSILGGSVLLMIVGLICLKKNLQIPAFAFTLVAGIAQIITLNSNDNISLAFLDKGVLSNKFFWYHHAPIILLIVFSLIVFVIGVKSKIQLRKDYNRTLSSMFSAYSEAHPTVSDAEWTAHLEELDKELSEAKD